jgi:hypothetical protein
MAITAAAQPNAAPSPKAVRNVMVVTNPPCEAEALNDLQGGSFQCFRGLRRRRNLGHSFVSIRASTARARVTPSPEQLVVPVSRR